MKLLLNRILLILSACAACIILAGTIFAFAAGTAHPGSGTRKSDLKPQEISKDMAAFTELGQIRALTLFDGPDSQEEPVVVTPWLSYKAGDKSFYEELVQKNRKIKSIIADYFSAHTQKELLSSGEKKIKDELLHQINSELILGKISAVYFSEYIFL